MTLLDARRRAPGRSAVRLFLAWTCARSVVQGVLWLLYRLRCEDADRVPRTGPIVYVANHQSHLDPPVVGILVRDRPCAFLARASLFDFKPFGWLISFLGAVPLERERRDTEAMRAAIAELKAGRCVLLFPEGTRCRDGALGRFRRGFMMLVKRTGATVVPVAVEGAFDAWPITRRLPRLRGLVAAKAGEPLTAGSLLALQDPVDEVRRRIDAMRMELRAELRRRTGGRYPAPGPGDEPVGTQRDPAAVES